MIGYMQGNIKGIIEDNQVMFEDNKVMFNALKLCYRKHVLEDDSIGWKELSSHLNNVLGDVMGYSEFLEWAEGY